MSMHILEFRPDKLSYLDCHRGQLHEGEQLSFVCLDNRCMERGLICPVCHELDHRSHRVMPLKIFLGELAKKYNSFRTRGSERSIEGFLAQL
jgi:hypothetical protein